MTIPKFKNIRIEAINQEIKIVKLKISIKLSANESALGCSPKAKKHIE